MKNPGNKLFIGIFIMGIMMGACCQQGDLKFYLAEVSRLEVLMMESFPLQANVQVTGYLPNPCYHIPRDKIEVSRVGNVFTVTVYQAYEKDKICIQVLANYQIEIPLNIYGLKAGLYEVWVNGKKTTFTLKYDNHF